MKSVAPLRPCSKAGKPQTGTHLAGEDSMSEEATAPERAPMIGATRKSQS
jgi:hypothetical protein